MTLSDFEQSMFDGDMGPGVQLAMRVQVAIGEAFDAPYMLPVTRTHVALSNQEADRWFVEKLVAMGAKCRVPPTVNPGFDLEYFTKQTGASALTQEDVDGMMRTERAYKAIGAILNYSCTPYLFDNVPRRGEVLAFSESSATPYVNAIYGALTNRESAQSALCAAVTGRVPYYGLLVPENRLGTVFVRVDAHLTDDFSYQLLGYATPRRIGSRIPIFLGVPDNVTPEAFTALGAELNTAGAVPMFHVLGITPEALTMEQALGKRHETDIDTVVITDHDLREIHQKISKPAGAIDFALLGCPHLTLNQIRTVAEMVDGKHLKAELWLNTSAHTVEMAERTGLKAIIEQAGGHLLKDTCVDQPIWHHLEGGRGVTESPKCAYYTTRRQLDFVIRSLETCIVSALEGAVVE